MTKKGIDWDDNLVRRLTALHRGGLRSFAEIAEILSREFGLKLTKNACIGKGRRLGLEQRPRGTTKPGPKPRAKPKRRPPEPPAEVVPVVLPAWQVETPILTGCNRITIYQLQRGVCHYPFGEKPPYAYCGNTTSRQSPWCPHHLRVVYPRGPR